MSKQQQLDDIAARIVEDNICPELREGALHMVFGEGSPNAEIVFIGEAPGRKEDETGKPFVGASGKFLSEMLTGIGLERKDVYITSIVKYRPPNNRDPSPEEKHAFMPYLQAQLEVIAPKVIMTLGRHSTNCFLPDLRISEVHGQLQHVRIQNSNGKGEDEWVILPLFHPAAALYNASMRQTLIDDFSQIPNVLHELKTHNS